jgi:hypothetical protein
VVQPICKVGKHIVQALKLDIQVDGAEAKVQHSAVWLYLPEYEIAKVAIEGYENSLFADCDG